MRRVLMAILQAGRVHVVRMEHLDADRETIRASFESYASASEGPFRGLGCLLCNTAVERAALDPASGRHVAAYLERITQAFRHALDNARSSGEIGQTTNLDETAAFLTTSLIGVAASVRAEAPPEQLWSTAKVVAGVLDAAAV